MEKETVNHYLIECAKYEYVREKMRKILFDFIIDTGASQNVP